MALPVALVALLATPLAVALAVLRDPHWYPLLDVAMTELRIRDVTGGHPPLVGLPGRFEGLDSAGSHPGPISFWALAPLYRLFGGDAWAMQAATASLNLLAMAATLAVAHRRAGRAGLLAAAAALAILVRAYEVERLTEAWNPHLPMLWWFLFLLAVWSVLCDDFAMLPAAVFAGTFCAQTHVPYVGLVAGLAALTVGATAAWLWPRRHDRAARRRVLAWGGGAVALLVVLWLPPVVEEVAGDPGNMSILIDSFRHPVDPPGRVADGIEAWLARLDVSTLVTRDQRVEGSPVPGVLLLAAWLAAVATARRVGDRRLRRLHAVAAAALALGLVSILRIPGTLWDYLVLWASGTTVLVVGATAWTGVAALRAGREADRAAQRTGGRAGGGRRRWAGAASAAGATALMLVVVTSSATYDATHAQVPQPGVSEIDRHLIPSTAKALAAGSVPGGGRHGRYLVTWDDALAPGLNGYTVLVELERRGFDVGMDARYRLGARPHRVMSRGQATALVTYVAGPQLGAWRTRPGAVLVAEYRPPAAARAEYARLRREVIGLLREAGLDDLVEVVDQNVLGTAAYVGMPAGAVQRLRRMLDIGAPAAVFVTGNPPAGPR